MLEIDRESILHQLQAIDDTADAPGPGAVLSRVINVKMRVKPVVGIRILRVAISRDLIMPEGDLGNIAAAEDVRRNAAAGTIHTDHGRKGAGSRRENNA
ncbi:MAG: hypothetical protein ILNGONEN_01124 [Syntrophorhabdaceae bacterium]|nr:hypothetical protein [Syntrophorhabdaceae bacterium]